MMKDVIKIGGREIGQGNPAYIIAEIGSNHDGDLDKAKGLIRASREAGADAVKFQSFTAEGLLNPLRPGKDGAWVEHPAYKVIERLTLPEDWHGALFDLCRAEGITFLSAPFDEGRAALLGRLGVDAFKIASGDITDEPLLRKVAGLGKPVILSTGASYMDEVERAVDVLARGSCTELALLHCSALYPPSFGDVNLRAMAALKERFGCPVGFSDHTPGSTLPVATVALGGAVIEKHVTYDKRAEGPDHPYAMEFDEFREMVRAVREIEAALGDGVKRPSEAELPMRVLARRGVYAGIDISKGETIRVEMLKVVRQAIGLTPFDLGAVIGRKAAKDMKKDMPIRREDLC